MLADVYSNTDKHYSILYQCLMERQPYESISHTGMPTWSEHLKFVESRPYKSWWIIYENISAPNESDIPVGSIYLTYKNEIGIHIFNRYRRMGFGENAIVDLMSHHKERFYLANINPINEKSIKFFTERRKFKHIQNTYKYEDLNIKFEEERKK